MKKSFVNEASLVVTVTVDMGEVNGLIEILKEADTENGHGNYRANALRQKLETLRREAADEAKREFEKILEKS